MNDDTTDASVLDPFSKESQAELRDILLDLDGVDAKTALALLAEDYPIQVAAAALAATFAGLIVDSALFDLV